MAGCAAAKAALAGRLKAWPPEAVSDHLERLYPPYWLGFDGETHARHAAALAERGDAPLVLGVDVARSGPEKWIVGDHFDRKPGKEAPQADADFAESDEPDRFAEDSTSSE